MNRLKLIEANKKNIYFGKSNKGYGFTYFAKKKIKKGEIIMHGYGKIIDHQTSHCSVQIDIAKHYLPSSWTGRYWNHSCNPNAYIRSRKDGFPDLVALKDIRRGEEITYSYWMTEHKWINSADENSVTCKCGGKQCKNRILSFSQLSKNEQNRIKRRLLCSKYLHNV